LQVASDTEVIGLGLSATSHLDIHAYYSDSKILKHNYPEVDVIYLLGSFIPYGMFSIPNSLFVKSNIQLVVELSLLYPDARIVFSSSVSVYGYPAQLPLKIDSPFVSPDLYGLSKIAGEAIVRNHKSHAIIRFSSIIGKGMGSTSMIPKLIDASRNGMITILGKGDRLQNYIDVRDAVQICLKAAMAEKQILALGIGERSYSNTQVAEYIRSITNSDIVYTGVDASPSFVYDANESYTMLNFKPQYTLQQSLNDIIEQ
jgi:UDP-glucose 4-epimerase